MYGFYRVAAAVPETRVADIAFNLARIKELVREAGRNSAALAVFPELCMTSYTCADLFQQSRLIRNALSAVLELANFAKKMDIVIVVGAPFLHKSRLYNCAFVIQKGKIKGIVPKTYNPNYREFYEKRWFTSGKKFKSEIVRLGNSDVPFGRNLVFECDENFKLAVEICEDLWNVIPPSSYHAIAGATVIANLSASNELVAKADYRRDLVKQQSARCLSAYVYSSAGVWESTTDLVFSGHSMIAENGIMIAENERFRRKGGLLLADIDCERIAYSRFSASSFSDNEIPEKYVFVKMDRPPKIASIRRKIDPHPFVPSNPALRDERCREIFSIQSAGLAKRLGHTKSSKAVIGISGGLDSTLALLVSMQAMKLIGKKSNDIIAITMPGFGTTGRTYKNAVKLCQLSGTELREIDIKAACKDHFKEIGHNPKVHDVTYENVQARERTQILMDIANKEKGIVVGTGDLSEIALGWSTYSGDHMSMYAVNCGVPKTLIRYLISWVAENSGAELKKVLHDIIDTPVTPELLPHKGDGKITQKTEEIIGPYELHDFFLFHTVKYGASPEKILHLANLAFKGKYTAAKISECLKTFIRRFFSQQFKRSCIPDGPKVGSISLSPRGDWRMPSDASYESFK
ncbi:MAG TPA: NAD(+) synthase [Lentisphaeria bacterium]|nr:MAG: NAD(+) synthase [Lentisphaerae bacterium GWF2_49_21]HBC85548.1 NAD(+) synthase [Lentisphaeria bacterium]